jgi:PAS domain S-box-containing protein
MTLLSLATELANLGAWEYDPETGLYEFNDNFYAIYGTSVAREGRFMDRETYIREFVHPEDVGPVVEKMERKYLSGEDNYTGRLEHRIIRRDGEVRTISVRIKIIRNAGGNIIRTYGANQDITEQKEAEKKILSYQEKLQAMVMELSLTEEKERRRLAVALHDHVSQHLALAKIKLMMVIKPAEERGCGCANHNNEILMMLNEAIQNSRSLTSDLCPPILYELGFEAAVQNLAEKMQELHQLIFVLKDDGTLKPLTEETKIILFKAVRELFINVVKHAEASIVQIFIGSENGKIKVEIVDDGKGFELSKSKGFGLFNISERLNYIGGSLCVESTAAQGTRVTLTGPLLPGDDGGV